MLQRGIPKQQKMLTGTLNGQHHGQFQPELAVLAAAVPVLMRTALADLMMPDPAELMMPTADELMMSAADKITVLAGVGVVIVL
jgi:hypothetical protein